MNTNFIFVDENKNFVQMSGSDVLYTVNQLNYQYEDPRTCIPPWWYNLVASAHFTLASEVVCWPHSSSLVMSSRRPIKRGLICDLKTATLASVLPSAVLRHALEDG